MNYCLNKYFQMQIENSNYSENTAKLILELKKKDGKKVNRDKSAINVIYLLLMNIEGVNKYFNKNKITKDYIKEGIKYMYHKQYKKGEIIFKQGDKPDSFFGLIDGEIHLILQESRTSSTNVRELKEIFLASLKAGECFGERGIINFRPRACSAIAAQDTNVFYINAYDFKMTLSKPIIKLEASKRDFIMESLNLETAGLICDKIYNKIVFKQYSKNDIIYKQGNPSDAVYIVFRGRCDLIYKTKINWNTNKDIVMFKVEKGSIFGGDFLINKINNFYSVKVLEDFTTVAELKAEYINDCGFGLIPYLKRVCASRFPRMKAKKKNYTFFNERVKPTFEIDNQRNIILGGESKIVSKQRELFVFKSYTKIKNKNMAEQINFIPKNSFCFGSSVKCYNLLDKINKAEIENYLNCDTEERIRLENEERDRESIKKTEMNGNIDNLENNENNNDEGVVIEVDNDNEDSDVDNSEDRISKELVLNKSNNYNNNNNANKPYINKKIFSIERTSVISYISKGKSDRYNIIAIDNFDNNKKNTNVIEENKEIIYSIKSLSNLNDNINKDSKNNALLSSLQSKRIFSNLPAIESDRNKSKNNVIITLENNKTNNNFNKSIHDNYFTINQCSASNSKNNINIKDDSGVMNYNDHLYNSNSNIINNNSTNYTIYSNTVNKFQHSNSYNNNFIISGNSFFNRDCRNKNVNNIQNNSNITEEEYHNLSYENNNYNQYNNNSNEDNSNSNINNKINDVINTNLTSRFNDVNNKEQQDKQEQQEKEEKRNSDNDNRSNILKLLMKLKENSTNENKDSLTSNFKETDKVIRKPTRSYSLKLNSPFINSLSSINNSIIQKENKMSKSVKLLNFSIAKKSSSPSLFFKSSLNSNNTSKIVRKKMSSFHINNNFNLNSINNINNVDSDNTNNIKLDNSAKISRRNKLLSNKSIGVNTSNQNNNINSNNNNAPILLNPQSHIRSNKKHLTESLNNNNSVSNFLIKLKHKRNKNKELTFTNNLTKITNITNISNNDKVNKLTHSPMLLLKNILPNFKIDIDFSDKYEDRLKKQFTEEEENSNDSNSNSNNGNNRTLNFGLYNDNRKPEKRVIKERNKTKNLTFMLNKNSLSNVSGGKNSSVKNIKQNIIRNEDSEDKHNYRNKNLMFSSKSNERLSSNSNKIYSNCKLIDIKGSEENLNFDNAENKENNRVIMQQIKELQELKEQENSVLRTSNGNINMSCMNKKKSENNIDETNTDINLIVFNNTTNFKKIIKLNTKMNNRYNKDYNNNIKTNTGCLKAKTKSLNFNTNYSVLNKKECLLISKDLDNTITNFDKTINPASYKNTNIVELGRIKSTPVRWKQIIEEEKRLKNTLNTITSRSKLHSTVDTYNNSNSNKNSYSNFNNKKNIFNISQKSYIRNEPSPMKIVTNQKVYDSGRLVLPFLSDLSNDINNSKIISNSLNNNTINNNFNRSHNNSFAGSLLNISNTVNN